MHILLELSDAWHRKREKNGTSKNRVPNFLRVIFFEPTEGQTLSQTQAVNRSCFTAREMLACPLAYIISPDGEAGVGGRVLEDKWSSFHWQARLFPPSGGAFSWAEVWRSIGLPGGSERLRQPPHSRVFLLTGRETAEASRKPEVLSSSGLQLARTEQNRTRTDLSELETKRCLMCKKWIFSDKLQSW